MKELLMLNDALMNAQFFVNLVPAEERFYYLVQDGVIPHTATETIRALRGMLGEFNGEDRIIRKGLWPPRLKQISNKLRGLSPRANYTDKATAACRRS
jgi:hypothetical protein